MIEQLNWDSEFFGYPVGKVELGPQQEIRFDDIKSASKGFKLLCIFSEDYLADERFILVDEKVTLSKSLLPQSDTTIYNYSQALTENLIDFEKLQELAYLSGQHSRFKLDKHFTNNEFKKLYTEWIIKSIHKEIALETLIIAAHNDLKGFISLAKINKDNSKIGLIAVNPNFQGQGLGSKLLKDAESLASYLGFQKIHVDTQKRNEAGMRLYLKNGYVVSSIKKVYHLWND